MLVRDLESSLLARFPRGDAEAWDHVGLSVGDPDAEVRGVLCSLDATLDSLRAACSLGCNVLLTHHPVYISAPDSFCPPSAPLEFRRRVRGRPARSECHLASHQP